MSEEVARKSIDWLFANCGNAPEVCITFFGGEPLLNKPVLRFAIEYSQELAQTHGKTVRYSMTTNGTLLDDEVIGYIKRYNFGLMVSLDGPPEIHDAQRPFHDGSGSFATAAAGIKRLMDRRKQVTVRCTVTQLSPPLSELISFFDAFGFTRFAFGIATNPVNGSNIDCDDLVLERMAQEETAMLDTMIEQLRSGQKPKHFPYRRIIDEMNQAITRPRVKMKLRCGACHGTLTTGADGCLYPCHRFLGMRNYIIGDIDNGPDIQLAAQFWRDYYAAQSHACEICWARAYCGSLCPWNIATEKGGFEKPAKLPCGLTTHQVEWGAWLHWYIQTQCPEAMDLVSQS